MFFSRFFIFAIGLYCATAYDLNYPSKPNIKVTCDGGDNETYIRIGQKYYFTDLAKVTWFDAAHLCRRYGGDLALIESGQEMEDISNYLISRGHDANAWFWISGNDLVTTHQFMSITNGLALPFTAWSTGQPDFPGVEQCMHLWLREGSFKMNNWKCNEKAHYLCQRQNYTRCWDGC